MDRYTLRADDVKASATLSTISKPGGVGRMLQQGSSPAACAVLQHHLHAFCPSASPPPSPFAVPAPWCQGKWRFLLHPRLCSPAGITLSPIPLCQLLTSIHAAAVSPLATAFTPPSSAAGTAAPDPLQNISDFDYPSARGLSHFAISHS